ncbi:hypothetical protein [Streptomyces sp. NPDC058086]|uniref:hypothetical protein n=1 Tax=Streptomyces sp. NPDC058086 TaxID=3346334 RepID=UPI0036E370AA
MDTTHVAVDGWVDAIPAPGPRGTATFDLIVRPADADTAATDTPDTVVSCTSGAPQITHALLTDIQPGDLLRVTGMLVHPQAPGEAARLTVHGLEEPGHRADLGPERHGAGPVRRLVDLGVPVFTDTASVPQTDTNLTAVRVCGQGR